ncbi:MAG: NepR family anti-sigma factor [Inquilinaceae bacterium]
MTARSTKAGLPEGKDAIDDRLRAAYDKVVQEPLPLDLEALAAALRIRAQNLDPVTDSDGDVADDE